jgi:hypothetical protein
VASPASPSVAAWCLWPVSNCKHKPAITTRPAPRDTASKIFLRKNRAPPGRARSWAPFVAIRDPCLFPDLLWERATIALSQGGVSGLWLGPVQASHADAASYPELPYGRTDRVGMNPFPPNDLSPSRRAPPRPQRWPSGGGADAARTRRTMTERQQAPAKADVRGKTWRCNLLRALACSFG